MKKRLFLFTTVLGMMTLFFLPVYMGGDVLAAKKHVLRIEHNETPQVGMNPWPARKEGDYIFLNFIYEPLCMPMLNGTVEPWIAKSWEYKEGEDAWYFYLDERARWSDGKPITARDVKFSFETTYKNKFPMGSNTKKFVTAIEVVNDRTVKFTMAKSFAAFLPLAGGHLIMPEHIWSKIDKVAEFQNPHPLGSGPFLFKKFQPRQYLHLVKNPDYWQGPAHIDEIIIQVYTNLEAEIVALKKGEMDIKPGTSSYSMLAPLEKDPNVKVLMEHKPHNFYIAPNHRIYPLNLKGFREALNLAVDRVEIVKVAMMGNADMPLMGYVPPIVTKWANPKVTWQGLNATGEQRMREANAILDKMGLKRGEDGIRVTKDGKKLEFRLRVVTSSSYIRASEIIKENLGELGIQVNIRVTEPRSLYSAFIYSQKHDLDWDLFVHGSSMSPDPDHFARSWCTNPPGRWTNNGAFGYRNESLQTLLDQSRREMDDKKRWEMIQKAQEMFADDLAVIMLAHKYIASVHRTDKFSGWQPTQVMYGAMYHSLLALPNILSLKPIQ